MERQRPSEESVRREGRCSCREGGSRSSSSSCAKVISRLASTSALLPPHTAQSALAKALNAWAYCPAPPLYMQKLSSRCPMPVASLYASVTIIPAPIVPRTPLPASCAVTPSTPRAPARLPASCATHCTSSTLPPSGGGLPGNSSGHRTLRAHSTQCSALRGRSATVQIAKLICGGNSSNRHSTHGVSPGTNTLACPFQPSTPPSTHGMTLHSLTASPLLFSSPISSPLPFLSSSSSASVSPSFVLAIRIRMPPTHLFSTTESRQDNTRE